MFEPITSPNILSEKQSLSNPEISGELKLRQNILDNRWYYAAPDLLVYLNENRTELEFEDYMFNEDDEFFAGTLKFDKEGVFESISHCPRKKEFMNSYMKSRMIETLLERVCQE